MAFKNLLFKAASTNNPLDHETFRPDPDWPNPYAGKGTEPENVKYGSKPKCPHCGSSNYALMPSDFETAKCDDCGKNWNHGIVPGINDPSDSKTAAQLLREAAGSKIEECAARAVAILGKNNIPSLIVGGYAVQELGYPRQTIDVDIVVPSPTQAAMLLMRNGFEKAKYPGTVIDRASRVEVDLMQAGTSLSGSKVPLPHVEEVVTVPKFIDLVSLIDVKLGSYESLPMNRSRDLGDVVELIKRNQLDANLLQGRKMEAMYRKVWKQLHQEKQAHAWTEPQSMGEFVKESDVEDVTETLDKFGYRYTGKYSDDSYLWMRGKDQRVRVFPDGQWQHTTDGVTDVSGNLDDLFDAIALHHNFERPAYASKIAHANFPDPGKPDSQDGTGYDYSLEEERRKDAARFYQYAEEGATFDPKGDYLCGTCTMRSGENQCRSVEGKISFTTGSCRLYKHGPSDGQAPLEKKANRVDVVYTERPNVRGYGCHRCEYSSEAAQADDAGRPSWCSRWGAHVQPNACCAKNEGEDDVEFNKDGTKKANFVPLSSLKTAADEMYHVTHTRLVPKIQKKGILPLQTTNWTRGEGGERYGTGEIYAGDNATDAVRWAARQDWAFNKGVGTGKVSIIKFRRNPGEKWEVDSNDPLSQAGNMGKWYKLHGRVKPEDIISVHEVVPDLVRQLNPSGGAKADIKLADTVSYGFDTKQIPSVEQPNSEKDDDDEDGTEAGPLDMQAAVDFHDAPKSLPPRADMQRHLDKDVQKEIDADIDKPKKIGANYDDLANEIWLDSVDDMRNEARQAFLDDPEMQQEAAQAGQSMDDLWAEVGQEFANDYWASHTGSSKAAVQVEEPVKCPKCQNSNVVEIHDGETLSDSDTPTAYECEKCHHFFTS